MLFAALLAAGAASDRRGGSREAWARGLIAAGIMVAPGTWQGSAVLLGGPDHTAVGVPVLITLLVVDRVVPRRWRPAAATLAADVRAAGLGAARRPGRHAELRGPAGRGLRRVGGGGSDRGRGPPVRRRRPRAARPAGRRRPELTRDGAQSPAYNAALALLAAASFGVTELLIKAISHVGGFYSRAIPASSQISHWATVPAQVHALGENLLILFGANFWRLPQPQAAFAYLHLICLALALIGLVVSIARWRTADRVTRALVVGVFVMLAAGAASPLMIPNGGTHEIAVILPLGAVLGGRVVGPWLAARPAGRSPGRARDPGVGGRGARRGRPRPAVLPRLRGRAAGRAAEEHSRSPAGCSRTT